MMRVILTRPLEKAQLLAERLKSEGDEVLLAPMLRISFLPVEEPAEPLQAVIFTSVQGVEGVANAKGFQIFPAFTVGTKTASSARQVGFERVFNADGDVEDLLRLILAEANTGKGPLVHLCGDLTTGNLVERLRERGFDARRQKVYETHAQESLPATVAERIRARGFDAALFFSPRSASLFCRIAREKELADFFRHAAAVAMSEAVKEEAAALPWKKIHTAERPTESAVLAVLQTLRK
ncbi:MAG TPA: uroporphyrinogen-III synthase [Sphingomonadales bacterium]|nr:uroporphyrinogen-III synthase [Sphingomonadales bacterium]